MEELKSARPDKLTGGCLCGSIRYTITFTPEVEWPPTTNGSCQCTSCRKLTGSLIHQGITVPLSALSPAFTGNSTYKQFSSSERGRRGFCSTCGSSLTFRDVGLEKIEVMFGSFDEEVLTGRWGSELCGSKNHGWCENGVKGVSDALKGRMWRREPGGERMGEAETEV